MVKTKMCVFCGKRITGYGNNPWPLTREGKCCGECNMRLVLPERIKMHLG